MHIYAQELWHEPAYVVGTRASLSALASAITEALASGSSAFETFAADGEGYTIQIQCVSEEKMLQFGLPYTHELAKESLSKDEKLLWPWKLNKEKKEP